MPSDILVLQQHSHISTFSSPFPFHSTHLFVIASIHTGVGLCMTLNILLLHCCLSVCPLSIYLPVYLSFCVSVGLPIYLSLLRILSFSRIPHLSFFLSLPLFVSFYIYLFLIPMSVFRARLTWITCSLYSDTLELSRNRSITDWGEALITPVMIMRDDM